MRQEAFRCTCSRSAVLRCCFDTQVRQWAVNVAKPVHLLCDARSTPPRIAAVCICDSKVSYSDMQPSASTLAQFTVRGDNQIASLELLAIAFGQNTSYSCLALRRRVCYVMAGLSSFEQLLKGQNIVVHSDNTTAEHSVRKGRARTFDHTAVVHSIWTKVWKLGAGMTVLRVGSKQNLSDDPSRERYGLLDKIGATKIPPVLDECFLDAQAWDSLAITAHREWLREANCDKSASCIH